MTIHEYAFDLTLTGAIRVKAASEEEAREMLETCLSAVDVNFGAWPDGSPILGEVSYNREDRCDLFEIDGEEAPYADDDE